MHRWLSLAFLVACNAAPSGAPAGPGATPPDARAPDSHPPGMSNVIVSLSSAQVRPAVLEQFLDRLQARGARVVTVSNVVGGSM